VSDARRCGSDCSVMLEKCPKSRAGWKPGSFERNTAPGHCGIPNWFMAGAV
jgi:hypothetical protein